MGRFATILAATTVFLAVCGINGMASAGERDAASASFVSGETARPMFPPMSKVPSARPAQTQHAQMMGNICRWGYYWCTVPPQPVGFFCFCPNFPFGAQGVVHPY